MTTLLATAAAAFTYGFVGSLHCAAMCGPLCSALLASRPADAAGASRFRLGPLAAALAYSATRVLAYGALGGVAGAIGHGASGLVGALSSRTALVFFAALLAGVALPWNRLATRWPFRRWRAWELTHSLLTRLTDLLLGLPRTARGAFLGLATPLLPCGFLYGALAGAVASGSLAGGLVTMLSFAVGTVPILVAIVAGVGGASRRLPAGWARILQTAVALAGAALFLHAAVTMPDQAARPGQPPACPHCDTANH